MKKNSIYSIYLRLLSSEYCLSTDKTVDVIEVIKLINLSFSVNEHCHPNRDSTSDHQKARRKLIFASILCLIFMAGESVGKFRGLNVI